MSLEQDIEKYFSAGELNPADKKKAMTAFKEMVKLLNAGTVRSAEKTDGYWKANTWVKKGILLGFRLGKNKDMSIFKQMLFFDKDTLPVKPMKLSDGVRIVPGGSTIRTGAYIGKGVICMPPMYVNIGAYVDDNSLIDSQALVGSCAQLGKKIHL